MNILTQNVCGLNPEKIQTISNNISPRHDILVLTETHLKRDNCKKFIDKLGYRNHTNRIFNDISPDPLDYRGVSLIIAKRTNFIPYKVHKSETGNHIIAIGKFQNKPLIIGGFYGHASNSDRQSRATLKLFLDKINSEIVNLTNPMIAILGDFNFITDPSDHSNPNYGRKNQTETLFISFIRQHDLIDTHLETSESDIPSHTFKRADVTARLDRIYFSRAHVTNSIFKQGLLVKSDHTSLTFNWSWRKPSLMMRFPDYLLKSNSFLTKLHDSTRELLITNCNNQSLINDYHDTIPNHPLAEQIKSTKTKDLKITQHPNYPFHDQSNDFKSAKLRAFAKQFADSDNSHDSIISLTKLGKITSDHTSDPELLLTTLLSQAVDEGVNHARKSRIRKTQELERIKKRLLQYTTSNKPHDQNYLRLTTKHDQIQETINFRNKFSKIARYNAENSKTTSYFLADSDFSSRTKITKLIDKDGNPHVNDDARKFALNHFKNFFTTNATSEPTTPSTIPDFLKTIPPELIKKIPPCALEPIPTNFTEAELDAVILKPHKGSAPGLSGTSYELIKHLYPIIKPLLLKFANTSIAKGILSPSLRSKKVIFIPKPNKDPTDPSSLRPICLLEILFKVISSMTALRLKRLSSHIITYHQNAYTESSSITNAARTILDYRSLASTAYLDLAIIGLDFSSAFDKIGHDFALAAMDFFGFPPNLRDKVKTLLNSPRITLLINGELGEIFEQAPVGSGQGDPISSFVFSIAIQILLIRLSYDPLMPRFQLEYHNHATSSPTLIKGEPVAFADDINLLQSFKQPRDLDYLLTTLTRFTSISNLPLNNSKTEFLPVNVTPEVMQRVHYHNLKVVDTLKFVGAYVTANKTISDEAEINFKIIDEKAANYMSKSKLKNSTVIGATVLYNTKLISKYTHLLTNYHPSQDRCDSMNQRAINYSREFSNGRFLVQKKRYFLPYQDAGMNLRNIQYYQNSLLIHWWRQFQKPSIDTDQNWAAILSYHLNSIGLKISDLPHLGHSDIRKTGEKLRISSPFWSSTFLKTSSFIKHLELEAPNHAILPMFGGTISTLTNRPTLSVFAKYGKTLLTLIRHGYSRPVDFGKPWDFNENFIDCSDPFSLHELNIPELGDASPAYELVLSTMADIIDTTTHDLKLYHSYRYIVYRPLTIIQDEFRYKSKGCSKFYQLATKRYCQSNFISDPPGRKSANRTYGMDISLQSWSMALKKTMKAIVSPSAIDLSYKIFLRQNWTPLKQSLATKDPHKATCVSCGHPNANTEHIYLECFIASDLWALLDKLISSTFDYRINTTPEQILFHQNIASHSHSVDKVILDLIISCKSLLQTFAFRDIHLPLINQFSLKASFFNSILSTIFANKHTERLIPYYHSIYDKLISQYNPNLPMSFV